MDDVAHVNLRSGVDIRGFSLNLYGSRVAVGAHASGGKASAATNEGEQYGHAPISLSSLHLSSA